MGEDDSNKQSGNDRSQQPISRETLEDGLRVSLRHADNLGLNVVGAKISEAIDALVITK